LEKIFFLELYNQNFTKYFGKATGFGDIVGVCSSEETLQIGNYVWVDNNGNGLQDPSELPIQNIAIHLYDDKCRLVSTTSTDHQGYYSFSSNIEAGNTYYLQLDPASFDGLGASYLIGQTHYVPTIRF